MLTAAQQAVGAGHDPRASMAKFREVIAKIRPGTALPEDPGNCSVLARAHEGLAFEYAADGETAKAIESLYSVAVLTLLFDDPRMRGRALAMIADLRESTGDDHESRKDLTTAALAFEAAGDDGEARALRDRRDGRAAPADATVDDVRRELAQMLSGVAGDAVAMTEPRAGDRDDAGPEGTAAPAAATAEPTEPVESVEPTNRLEWDELLSSVETGDVTGADAHDLLRRLLDAAGDDAGPDDRVVRRAAPLFIGFHRTNDIDDTDDADDDAFAEEVAVAARAVSVIDDPDIRDGAHGEITDRGEAAWTAALTRGDEALMAGDPARARRAYEFVLDSESMPIRATSSQRGAAMVGHLRAAIGAGNLADVRQSALDGANAVCRLPEAGDRARYGEQMATSLRDVNDATTLRMKLLIRVAENWSEVGDERSEVRCLLGAALCKAKLRDFEGAHADFLQLRLRAQELRDMALYSESLLHLGRSWAFAGRPDVAIQCYDAVVEKVTRESLDDDHARVGYARLLLEKARTLVRIPAAPPSAMEAARAHAVEARDIFAEVGAQGHVRETNQLIGTLPR